MAFAPRVCSGRAPVLPKPLPREIPFRRQVEKRSWELVQDLLDGSGYELQMAEVVFVTSVDLYLSPDFEPYLSPD